LCPSSLSFFPYTTLFRSTSAGQSVLVLKSNNHFGIKCKSEWTGPSVSHDDDARGECFRKYTSPFESYRDHSDFLTSRSHYASLRSEEHTSELQSRFDLVC